MWCFTLLLLVGAVVAQSEHEHGWETGKQYQYLVRSRTLSTLDQLKDQSSTGLIIRAVLTIQAASSDKLQAQLTRSQFARIHTLHQSEDLDSKLSDQKLKYQDLPLSEKPFQIVVKHGMVRDLLVDKSVPTWELNLLKGIVSQLQVDTQGENALHGRSTQEPQDALYGSYKAMEDTVGGKCEVLYDISPLSASDRYNLPELAPLLTGNEHTQLINIRKTKNYNNCKQQRGYHYGLTGKMSLTQGSEFKDRLTTKSTDSYIILSGDLKRFTIQSAVTTNHIFVKSERSTNAFIGTVSSKMNLTLVKMDQISSELLPNGDSENLVSTGNLLYTYNNPLTEIEQGKRHQQTISRNSQQVQSSESSSSSSEQHHGKNRQRQGENGSSSSSSAVSSSEEFLHLQTLPSLNEAPKSMTPLSLALQDMPQNSHNLVQEAQKHVRDITNNLQQFSNVQMQIQDTLERFTNLVNVLRQLNEKQIAEVEQGVLTDASYNSESGEKSTDDVWNVIRDGVAQTGTGPALLTIIRWVQSGKLTGLEAARVISKIPKVARIPSEDYVETVFEKLITDQKVQQQEYLKKIAPIAFSELVRKTQVDKRHSQNAYPIYNFGKLNLENDKAVTEKYIPYIEKQLQTSLKNGDNVQAQVYIVALGNFGHPRTLKVFEPYLEGQQQVSTYMRTLMVSSLRSLVQRVPGVVASVLYKIYLNEQESHEVRCAAVHLYMLTDPPLVSMLRMAKHTNFDKSQEVSAAVKSSIISLSKMKRPQSYLLSQKARYARRLLTPQGFSSTSSRGMYKDLNIVQITGSEDSRVPKNLYIGATSAFGSMAKSIFELEYGVSSVRQLLDIFERPEAHEESAWLNNIRQSLGMQDKATEPLEGHLRIATVIGTQFYPFDQQSIENHVAQIKKNLMKDQNVHINHMDSYEETVSFPTESGMPFTFSIEVPMLTRINLDKKQAQDSQPNGQAFTGIGRVLHANKVQTRFGVVESHEQQHYVAGVDKNFFVHIPIGYNVNIESKEPFRSVELKIKIDPEIKNSPVKLMHRSVVPFTAQLNMLDLKPVSQSNILRVINTNELQKSTIRLNKIWIVSEQDRQQTMLDTENIMEWVTSMLDGSINYKKVEVQYVFENGDADHDEAIVSAAYDEAELHGNNEGHENSILDNQIEITDKQPNSETRRKQLLQEVSKGLQSTKASVVDLTLKLPVLQSQQVLTIAVGESDAEQKMQYIVYWNRQGQSGGVAQEAMITGMVKSTQNDFLRYDKAIQTLPEDEFTIVARIGKNYKQADKIVLQGRLLQSENLKKILLKSKTAQQCLLEMQLGSGLKSCQKAIELALKKNLLQLSIRFDSEEQKDIANLIVSYLGQFIPTADVEFTNLRNDLRNKINMEVKMSPDYEKMETIIKTSKMNVKFQLQDPEYQLQEWQQDKNERFQDVEEQAICSLSEKELLTFDRKSYPLQLGGVWHVLLIPHQLPVSKNMKLAVLARKVDNRIQLRVLLGTHKEYLLQQLNDRFQVQINGQKVDLTKEHSYQDKENGKLLAEIFTQADGSVRLSLEKLGLDILFDGKLVRLMATEHYRNSVLGLCGNYDNQPDNDFITPQNCILQKPEEFSSTYALLDNDDHDGSRKTIETNKEKANRAVCTPLTSYQTNVINDKEAGRLLGKQLWGYHQLRNQNTELYEKKNQETVQLIYRTKIDVGDQEICFTVRPLPTCPQDSNPAEMKRKSVAMHCMPKNEAAYELKRRVEHGANPDLAHKSINKKQTFEIPSACYTY